MDNYLGTDDYHKATSSGELLDLLKEKKTQYARNLFSFPFLFQLREKNINVLSTSLESLSWAFSIVTGGIFLQRMALEHINLSCMSILHINSK